MTVNPTNPLCYWDWMTFGEGVGTVWEDPSAGLEDPEDPDCGEDAEWEWDL